MSYLSATGSGSLHDHSRNPEANLSERPYSIAHHHALPDEMNSPLAIPAHPSLPSQNSHFAHSYPSSSQSLEYPLTTNAQASSSSRSHGHFSGDREEDESVDTGVEEIEDPEAKQSSDQGTIGGVQISPKKKLRVTLPRGRACVACRNRKLKCTGERPCATCIKADVECRYEEIQRRRPRHVLLEERVVELEHILVSRGEQLPPSQLRGETPHSMLVTPRLSPTRARSDPVSHQHRRESQASGSNSMTPPASATSLSHISLNRYPHPQHPQSQRDRMPSDHLFLSLHQPSGQQSPAVGSAIDIPPHSVLESQLIRLVLPYTPFISMPIHPQRFLAVLTLSTNDPSRPHPALLYLLFAEAIRILEAGTPLPPCSVPPGREHFAAAPAPSTADIDRIWLASQVRGSSVAYLERARNELDHGIRSVDRPMDLLRAAIGITRYLYSLGRFIEGWNVPVARLVISCGLHRITGIIVPPHPPLANGEYPPTDFMPRPYASTSFYLQHHAYSALPHRAPSLRMRSIIVPPPRDEIDLAERTMTFWAAKALDWAASIGWGWSTSMSDDDCSTEWPWGMGGAETRTPAHVHQRFGVRDLFDPNSPIHMNPFPESTYVLSLKAMCLLRRASQLNDLPESSLPYLHADGRFLPDHIPPLHQIREVEGALAMLRQRLPPSYVFPPPHQPHPVPRNPNPDGPYDIMADPWYILLHANLLTAEMLVCRELTHYDGASYPRTIACARGVVQLVKFIQPENWIHLDLVVVINLSLVARLLQKESDRLVTIGQNHAATMAAEEADMLSKALAGDYARWVPMAGLHALIVDRVKAGMAEKEGEYERV